jgi:hypothetical protein
MKARKDRLGWSAMLLTAGLALWGAPAFAAQNPPAAASPAGDATFEAQKAAFEALSDADRKTIQDGLVWTGDYIGIVDGAFGKRTRDSILAYQASLRAAATGILDAPAIARLAATAQKAKDGVRFQVFVDDKTGVKIGAPLKILERRSTTGAGSRLAKTDGSISLDLASFRSADVDLATLYARLSADQPGRKLTLKLSRPDFFVLSWEEAGRKIYSRYARAPASAPDSEAIRGFTLAYPGQAADFERIAIAIANSFEPFPAPSAWQPTAAAPPTTLTPAKAALSANGLLVAPGKALSAIGSLDCPHPAIDGRPAKFLREDARSGLSLIAAAGADAAVAAPILAPLGDDLIAVAYGIDEAAARPVLSVTAVSRMTQTAETKPLVLASLGADAVGAPLFDRRGALVALVARASSTPRPIAGVSPQAPHPVVATSDIERFLSEADVATAKPVEAAIGGAGRIAAEKSALVVAIACN